MTSIEPSPDLQHKLAQERTDAAHVRTFLAYERTYAAWLRTGLAAMASGFAIAELLTDEHRKWLIRALGAALILAGGSMFLLAYRGYRAAIRKLKPAPGQAIPLWTIGALSAVLSLVALAILALVLVG